MGEQGWVAKPKNPKVLTTCMGVHTPPTLLMCVTSLYDCANGIQQLRYCTHLAAHTAREAQQSHNLL